VFLRALRFSAFYACTTSTLAYSAAASIFGFWVVSKVVLAVAAISLAVSRLERAYVKSYIAILILPWSIRFISALSNPNLWPPKVSIISIQV